MSLQIFGGHTASPPPNQIQNKSSPTNPANNLLQKNLMENSKKNKKKLLKPSLKDTPLFGILWLVDRKLRLVEIANWS